MECSTYQFVHVFTLIITDKQLLYTQFLGRHESIHPRQETDKRKVNTKVQLDEPMSFIGVTYGNMGERLEKQKWLKDSCITKVHPSRGDSSQSWKPGVRAQPAGNPTSWRMSFSGCLNWSEPFRSSSTGYCLVLVAFLAWESSLNTGRWILSVSGDSWSYFEAYISTFFFIGT